MKRQTKTHTIQTYLAIYTLLPEFREMFWNTFKFCYNKLYMLFLLSQVWFDEMGILKVEQSYRNDSPMSDMPLWAILKIKI